MTLHTYDDIEQRSDEWYALRCGLVTASALGALITVGPPDALTVGCPTCRAEAESPCYSAARKTPTPIKSLHDARLARASDLPPVVSAKPTDDSRALTVQLVAERVTGDVEPTYINDDMWRGIEHEQHALAAYEKHTDKVVRSCGFMVREEKGWRLGYSPDGLVGDDGLVEVKCPRAKGHLRTILADEVPAAHMAQLQAGLLVTGRKWIDFISFRAGMPLWHKRVLPDPDWQAAIVAAVTAFETTAAEMEAAYKQATKNLPATERVADLEVVI